MADSDPAPDGTGPDGIGHRARLRQRLASGGGDALLDHELIEYLLALAIPRRDTKPLAYALLREFGGIGGVLTAEGDALARVHRDRGDAGERASEPATASRNAA